ncbi:MAG: efflux transporter outer membrane subunit [Rhodocyclaceae bacterium]|nr:efflux transporter outer membrane subunit [Rhodocyclaceae bacterium]
MDRCRQFFATLAPALLAAALAGCADMGNIRPQAQLLEADRLAAGIPSASAMQAQWPQARWWESYADPQLDALIAKSLSDNPGLHIAAARVRQAQAVATMAEGATLPGVGFSASATRQLFSQNDFIPPPQAGNYDWYNRSVVDASYDLDLWGRNRGALSAALDEARVAEAEAQMARLALENTIVRSYVQLALNYALKDIVADTLQRRRQALAITHKRLAAGLATEVEISQLEAELPGLEARLEQHEENITLIGRQLAVLSGQGPGAGEAIVRPRLKLDEGEWMQLPSALPADLIGRRPDVASRRWGVAAAGQRIGAAKAAFYPNINLMAFIGFQGLGFARFLSADSAVRGMGPAVSLPIFDGGRLRGNLGAQTAAYDIAVESYNETMLGALQSVSNALTVAQSQQHQQHLIESGVATARKARMLAGKGHAAGLTDYLVVLNSEVTLLREEEQAALIHARRLESYAGLMLALGGGLPSVPQPDIAVPGGVSP